LNTKWIWLACALASSAGAQIGNYLGPGILTRGAGDIGAHSGEQVDLRFFATAEAVYDNGIQPYSVDSKGNLIQVNGLYGVQGTVGAYGVHTWRRAQLGLNYRGLFRHYTNDSFYDGSDHHLELGYTYQPSKRIYFDMRAIAGTSSLGLNGPLVTYAPIPDSVVAQPTLLLFDSRTYYLESGMDVSILQSPRTIYTMGGMGYTVRRRGLGLINVNGYDLHGSVVHRLSRATSVGGNYTHLHFDFPGHFGEADINQYQGMVSHDFGRYWTLTVKAGLYQAEVQGLQQVALDPEVSALLGISAGIQAYYRKSTFPSGTAQLTRRFKNARIDLSYARTVTPGNGIYLTSRQQLAQGTLSYTGLQRWSLSLGGSYSTLSSIGQNIPGYAQTSGSGGATYRITGALHAVARYDARRQDITFVGYRRTGYRATVGLSFSPGNIPLSLW
jgi:hypothetical protein